jgi:microcin C transport system substrate-binding protein
MVPNWYVTSHRVSWWNKFGLPNNKPMQYQPEDLIVRYGWLDQNRTSALQKAMKENKSI